MNGFYTPRPYKALLFHVNKNVFIRYIIEDVFTKFHICVIIVASVLKSFFLNDKRIQILKDFLRF